MTSSVTSVCKEYYGKTLLINFDCWLNWTDMGKVLLADWMRMETLCEISTLRSKGDSADCWVDATGSATERKAGSGRLKSTRSVTDIERVEELVCSQEGQSGQHLSTREIAAELDIIDRSLQRIASEWVSPGYFSLNAGTKQKRLDSGACHITARRLNVRDTNFFLKSKPSCQQPEEQSLGGR